MSLSAEDLSFEENSSKYPELPSLILRKIDTALRGVQLSSAVYDRAREEGALVDLPADGQNPSQQVIGGMVLRDGTFIRGLETVSHSSPSKLLRNGEPYRIDILDKKIWLFDGDNPVEEVDVVPVPDFYKKKTSSGTPMVKIMTAWPPECLNLNVFGHCYSWRIKKPCKYCSYVSAYVREGAFHGEERHKALQDIRETVEEALKEEGRWSTFRLTGGSDPLGEKPYDREVSEYIKVLDLLKGYFKGGKVPCRLVSSAFPKDQCQRLADSGATSYEPHIEVWDEKLFEWVCPAKAEYFGRDYWINAAVEAVDIFGKGNVCTQFVAGAELAKPYGFKTEDEAIRSTLNGAEFFAAKGVTPVMIILWVGQGSVFYNQKQIPGSLEYYARLTLGFRDIRRKFGLSADFNDYRRCAVHPDADLARLDCHKF